MNNTQKKVRLKRVERFGDALAGALAAAGVTMLGFPIGNINTNIPHGVALLAVAFIAYGVFTLLAIELAAAIKDETLRSEEDT